MRRIPFWTLLAVVLVAGCGGEPGAGALDGTVDGTVDAAVSTDARPTDAQVNRDASTLTDGGPADGGEPDGGTTPINQCGLLLNGDAEGGNIAGWTVEEGEFGAVQGATLQYPDPHQGSWSFSAGEAAVSVLSQSVDVSQWAADIDAGGLYASLEGWLRTWNGNDSAFLEVAALDASDTELVTARVGPYQDDQWMRRGAVIELPPTSRSVVVRLRGERAQGTDNDAYFDTLDLCVVDDPPLAPADDFLAPVYLMWPTEEGVSVRWETVQPTVGRVEYGTTSALGSVTAEAAPTTLHEVRLAGLPAGETIYYRVAWPGAYGEVQDFLTAPAAGSTAPFTFLVWGDNQDGTANFEGLITHMVADGAAFALSVGDTVSGGTEANYRDQILGPISALADHVPFLVAAGNHERYSDSDASLFDAYYSQPGTGPVAEHCFGWRWGPLYFLLLDSDLDIDAGSDQHTCIEQALTSTAAVNATFRVALFHKPPRIEWWYGGVLAFTNEMEAPWIRTVLEPHLESLGVDLVFNGHNHLYAYTPMTAGGITFVTTGGGGGGIDTDNPLWHVDTWPEIAVTHHVHHYMRLTVSTTGLTGEAVDDTGQVIHTFQLTP